MMLSLDTAYRSFGGEVEASSTPTICRLPDSRRHQLSAIARASQHLVEREGLWHGIASTLLAVGKGDILYWHVTCKSMVPRNDGCCVKSMRMVIRNGQPY